MTLHILGTMNFFERGSKFSRLPNIAITLSMANLHVKLED